MEVNVVLPVFQGSQALALALDKAGQAASAMDWLFAGDLLNQCIGSGFAVRGQDVPFFGLYGACSTMAESLSLAALLLDGGFATHAAAMTSSHFCSAERQYRTPLEYGGQRTPTAQWTVTGAGCVILSREGPGPYITHVTTGKIVDKGIQDANNMGAAMAPVSVKLTPYVTHILVCGTVLLHTIFRKRGVLRKKSLKFFSTRQTIEIERGT